MKDLQRLFWYLVHDESGQDLIEYALVAAVIGLGAAATVRSFATTLGNVLSGIGSKLTSAT